MKSAKALALLALSPVAVVGCGASSSPSSSTAGAGAVSTAKGRPTSQGRAQVLRVEADPSGRLAYVPKVLSAKAGNVTIDFTNPQGTSHDIAIEAPGGKQIGQSELIAESSTTLSLTNLKPGTYHYYCTVPGHREAGMEGTLTVS